MNDQTQGNRICLVLLDELSLFRTSLGHFLASEPGFEVIGECGTSAEALEILKSSTADVVLLDFEVGTENGNDFMSAARQSGYQGRFLIVAGALDVRKSAMALKHGASGIFLKSEAPNRLLQALKVVANGAVWVDQKVIQVLADQLIDRYSQLGYQAPGMPLDDRERNVLLGILGGLSNRKIGDNMGLSESSVKNVVQRLFCKAGVKTRSQLVRVTLEGSLGIAQQFVDRQPNETAIAWPSEVTQTAPTRRRQSGDDDAIT
jgi:DNA-binding NarL/FixJ family response regulator